MSKLVFIRDRYFDRDINNEENKKELEKLAGGKFLTLPDFNNKIKKFNAYVSTDLTSVKKFLMPDIKGLPFVLKALPVFYHDKNSQSQPYSHFYIGKIEIVD